MVLSIRPVDPMSCNSYLSDDRTPGKCARCGIEVLVHRPFDRTEFSLHDRFDLERYWGKA